MSNPDSVRERLERIERNVARIDEVHQEEQEKREQMKCLVFFAVGLYVFGIFTVFVLDSIWKRFWGKTS